MQKLLLFKSFQHVNLKLHLFFLKGFKLSSYFSTVKIPIPLTSSDSDDATQLFDSKHVYVSKHYKQVDNDTILLLLDKFKLEHKVYASGQISVQYCPFCPKPHNYERDNQFTLNIKPHSGAFFCFRCGIKGSWLDLKNLLYNGTENPHLYDYNKLIKPVGFQEGQPGSPAEVKLANEGLAFLHAKNLESKELEFIKNYLINKDQESRHLNLDVLKKYKVGAGFETFSNEKGEFIDVPVVYFPLFVPRSKKTQQKLLTQKTNFDEHSFSNMEYMLVRNKIRGVGKENKHYQRMDPSPGQWGIFGLNTLDPKNPNIVITEGEFDAMAVNQATGYQAISLPNGANHLPVQILPFLEKFTKIFLWMDADEVGQANARKFAEKLGINRTFIVNSRCLDVNGPKDANDALREDPKSLEKYLLLSKALSQENITTFSEMKAAVYHKILNFEESKGLKCQTLEWFNKKLKGFRRGEFTIYSGLTGSGKTTLLSQLSIDFCKQGVPTLWGSFEIKNEILMTNMLLQYSEANLIKEPKGFDFWANRFENLPLYFMKFFGSSELDKIISTIDFAIYTYDISHIVIDNLQFLLSGQGRGFAKFDLQDEAVSKFRQLATTRNVHVSLVIHPRKVDDTQEINMSSIFGTAKSTQEADNVFLIQNHKGYKVLELKKNRFDGEVGSIAVGFDKDTKSYFELYQHEVVDLENEKVKISDIVKRMRKQKEDKGDKGDNHEEVEQVSNIKEKSPIKNNEKNKKNEKIKHNFENKKGEKTKGNHDNSLQNEKEEFDKVLTIIQKTEINQQTANSLEQNNKIYQNTTNINEPKSEKIPETNGVLQKEKEEFENVLKIIQKVESSQISNSYNENTQIKPEKINETSKVLDSETKKTEETLNKILNEVMVETNKTSQLDIKGGNETLEAKREQDKVNDIIKEASGMTKEEKNNKNKSGCEYKEVLENRKKNMMMYNKIEKIETGSFFDEDYKVPKIDEIDEIINNTIKNYAKKK